MPWVTAQAHENKQDRQQTMLLEVQPCSPSLLTVSLQALSIWVRACLQTHLWNIYKIYCTFLEKCSAGEPFVRGMDLWKGKNMPSKAIKHWFLCHFESLGYEWGALVLGHKMNKCLDPFWNKLLVKISFRNQFHYLYLWNHRFLRLMV